MRPGGSSGLVGVVLGGALIVVGFLAVRPAAPARSGPPPATRAGAPRRRPTGPLDLPSVTPDTAPEDAPLRRELERFAAFEAAFRDRDGSYMDDAEALGYWPLALATVSFDSDSVGASWAASAYDPVSRRQCAMRVGPAPAPYFNPLPDGVVACRALPDTAESDRWDPSPPTTVWRDGAGHDERSRSGVLGRLRAMQVAWIGDGEEFGRDFVRLRDGLGRVPYPDEPGPRWATQDATVYLADAAWGDFDRDGRWEAIVRVVWNEGEETYDGYLGVVRERGGRLVNGPLYYIGDRTKLLGLRTGHGTVTADLVQRGDDDPSCCPTDTVRLVLAIDGDALVEFDDSAPDAIAAAGTVRGRARPALRTDVRRGKPPPPPG
jgi:hypothetical protein